MINKDNFKVCDFDKIIVNDNVTILPGYIEGRDGKLFMYTSIDPNNAVTPLLPGGAKNPKWRMGLITNRIVDEEGNSLVEETLIGGEIVKGDWHFCNTGCLLAWAALKEKEAKEALAEKAGLKKKKKK